MKRRIALLLVACSLISMASVPVNASFAYSEDPLAQKNYEEFGAAAAETEAVEETLPEETVAEETAPSEAPIPVETTALVEETVPAEKTAAETQAVEETAPAEDPDAPKGHNGIPLYFQNDYPNNIYGVGTIATNGCSAVCLAMVATYLTGHEYLPDEIARYFGGAAENNIARLEHGSEVMKLPYKKAQNWHETLAAIKEGAIAIIMVNSRSVFTQSQHFILVTGMNEDGKLMVNDSWKPNYEKWDCKDGLKNGFDPDAILAGYSGAWIYNKNWMPEKPYLYSEPEPVRGEPRYGVELTWEEIKLLAKVVWVEARGECNEGQQAVAEVVLNRLVSEDFPDTIHDVIYAENQFRSAKFLDEAQPYQLQYEMIENALYGPYVLPEDVYYFATSAKTDKIWGRIGGHVFCYAED